MLSFAFNRRRIAALAVVLLIVLLFVLSRAAFSFSFSSSSSPTLTNSPPGVLPSRRVWPHVAVASSVGWHFEIYMGIVGDLGRVLPPSSAPVRVYTPGSFGYGFDNVVEELGLFSGPLHDIDAFFRDVDAPDVFPDDEHGAGSGMIDLIVLGTCESDLREWHDRLLQSWDARPADKKFQILCLFHHGDDMHWHDGLVEWVRRGAIRLWSISEHVDARLRRNFRALGESDGADERFTSAGYEYIKTDVYVPMLDLPQAPPALAHAQPSRPLSDVGIVGSFRHERRDYRSVYRDLLASLEEDPQAWGYLPLSADPDAVYEADETSPLVPPFRLHLVGNAGDPEIPHALSNIAVVHSDLSYTEFYHVIQSLDLVIPAFATLEYIEAKASFSVAIALENNVPVLVTPWVREAYAFLGDGCVAVTRPQAVSEVGAVKALRTGGWSPRPHDEQQTEAVQVRIRRDADEMVRRGWRCSPEAFAAYKADVWARNREVVRRALVEFGG